MSGALRELLAEFQIKVDHSQLERADEKIGGFFEKLKAGAEAFGAAIAFEEVKEFFTSQIENAAHLQDLSERLEVSATAIRDFGFAAKGSGIDIDTAAHALSVLQRNMGAAMQGHGEQAAAFAHLGVALKDATGTARPFDEVLGDLADGLQKIPDHSTRAAFAMQTLGREGTALLPVLAKGRVGLEEMFKESRDLSGGLGNDFYANAKAAREEGEKFSFALGTLKNQVLAAALPALTSMLTALKGFAKSVIEISRSTNVLKEILVALAVGGGLKLASTLGNIATKLGLIPAEATKSASALMRLGGPALFAVAALYLLFDELYTMMTGGQTIIGDFLDDLGGIGTSAGVALELNAMFKDMIGLIGDAASALKDLFLGAVDAALAGVKGLGAAIMDIAHGKFGDIGKDAAAAAAPDWEAMKRRALAAGKTIVGTDTSAGNAGSHVNNLNTLLEAGIDPRMLQAGMLGHATAGSAAATKAGIVAQNIDNPLAHGWAPVPHQLMAQAGLGPSGIRAYDSRGVQVNLKVTNNIKSAHDNPKAIGEAAGMGTATAVEKSHNAALASRTRS